MSSSQRQRPAKFDVDPAGQLVFRKSSLSGGSECVEVAALGEVVFVRDSEEPDGPWLRFTHAQWRCFVEAVHVGEFDLL
jgi:Domain of unknown function (DUF397)